MAFYTDPATKSTGRPCEQVPRAQKNHVLESESTFYLLYLATSPEWDTKTRIDTDLSCTIAHLEGEHSIRLCPTAVKHFCLLLPPVFSLHRGLISEDEDSQGNKEARFSILSNKSL